MSQSASSTVRCPACRRRFVWRAELAGQVVRCDCKAVFAIGDVPERGPVSLEPGDFEEAPKEITDGPAVKCPSCNLPMKAKAVVCLNCGYDWRLKRKAASLSEVAAHTAGDGLPLTPEPLTDLGGLSLPPEFQTDAISKVPPLPRRSEVAQALTERDDDAEASPFFDWTLPIIFIVVGIAATIFSALQQGESLGYGLLRVGISLLIRLPVLLAALVFAAKLLGISYGPLSVGLLKLSGIIVGPMALADALLLVILGAMFGFGIWSAVLVYVIVLGIPVSFMFDLELQETFYTIFVIIFCELLFKAFLLVLLLGLFS